MAEGRRRATGTSDPTYNVVSVLYHALQGAQTIGQYIDDAKQSGDDELVKYLQRVKQTYTKTADQAKQLLVQRIEHEH